MPMTLLHIESSLNQWFSENYAGEADYGGIDQFDPEDDDLTSWTHFNIDKIMERPRRKTDKRIVDIRIVVQIWARDTEDPATGKKDTYRAVRLASQIEELLRHKEIPVKSYVSNDDPGTTVGNVRLFEPKTTDETDREDDENSGYSMMMTIIDGFAQES